MNERIRAYMSGINDSTLQGILRGIINPIADRMSTHSLTSAGLAIKSGGSAIVKTGAAIWYGIAQGKVQSKAAATDMPALVGTVTNALFNVFVFFVDLAGTVTVAMGTESATLANVKFPNVPEGKATLGFIIVNPTGTGNFVGGTTALDDATVVPNVAYVNLQGPLDPSILL